MPNEKPTNLPSPAETLSPREAQREVVEELINRGIGFRAIGLGGVDGQLGVRVTIDNPAMADVMPKQHGGVPVEVLVDR